MSDKNVFDEDQALDCIMNEEVGKENQRKSCKGGCFGILMLMILPVVTLYHFIAGC